MTCCHLCSPIKRGREFSATSCQTRYLRNRMDRKCLNFGTSPLIPYPEREEAHENFLFLLPCFGGTLNWPLCTGDLLNADHFLCSQLLLFETGTVITDTRHMMIIWFIIAKRACFCLVYHSMLCTGPRYTASCKLCMSGGGQRAAAPAKNGRLELMCQISTEGTAEWLSMRTDVQIS